MSPKSQGPFCPECSKPSTGNFCQHCGAKLGGRFCNQCGNKVSGGAKFCNQCGSGVDAGRSGGAGRAAGTVFGGQNLPWWIAGAAMFVVIMILGVSAVRPAGPSAPTGAATVAPGAVGAPPDLSQMTPIEAADRLFDRVMRSVSSGDSAQAQQFLPMAINAYDRARPLTHDGLFHLSMLNRTAMNLEAALDNALEVLEEDPNHLLALAAAAEAAIELGLGDEAEGHYRRILDVYDAEVSRGLEEYEMHSRIVDVLTQDAERYLAGR